MSIRIKFISIRMPKESKASFKLSDDQNRANNVRLVTICDTYSVSMEDCIERLGQFVEAQLVFDSEAVVKCAFCMVD